MSIIEEVVQNGKHAAHIAALPLFTFPDSGITVRLQRFSPNTIAHLTRVIRKDLPAPEAPLQEVDYGDGVKRMEPNESDPQYLAAMDRYQGRVAEELGERMIRLVVRRVDVEVDTEAVQRLRDDMEAIGSPIDDDDDKTIYVKHICIASSTDLSALSSYILRLSQPTEAAVREHIETFRGDV